MLKHEEKPYLSTAAEARVSARDLTEALASIEVRNARRAYDLAGTLTLAEAAAECSVEATPEELRAEVERIRLAEAVQRKSKRRQRLLRISLGAEVVSAALCLLVLLGMKHTEFDPDWQQTRMAADFQQKLRQSVGSHPAYEIAIRREGSPTEIEGVYPLYSLPEGYSFSSSESISDEGKYAMMPEFMPQRTAHFEFRKVRAPFFRDDVFVFYDGLQYRRGWIRRLDKVNVLQGHSFTFYRNLDSNPEANPADLIPLTLSLQSIQDAQGQWTFINSDGHEVIGFADGIQVQLDSHAWEQYSGIQ